MMDVRDYIVGIRSAYGKSARILAPLTDLDIPSRHRLRRFLHEVRPIISDSDEWLSTRTESVRDIRHRRSRAERVLFGEKFHRFLHWFYPIERSSLLGASIIAVTVGISLAIGTVLADADVPSRMSGLAGTLVTIAKVLGGAAGILFAVIVFGIQFHGERLGQASFLVRYLGRREGLVPIAAVTLSVVGANALTSLIASIWLPQAVIPMATMDLILVPGVLWLTLWLLYRMIVSVSGDFFDGSLIPGLSWEFQRGLDEDTNQALQTEMYREVLEHAGLRQSIAPGLFGSARDNKIEFKITRRGRIIDVNLTAIETLGKYLAKSCPDYDVALTVLPDDELEGQVVLVLLPKWDNNGDRVSSIAALDDKARGAIRRMLRQVFLIGSRRKRDVVDVLSRFSSNLVSQAKHDLPRQLGQALDVQKRLIELRLSRPNARRAEVSFHRESLPDHLGSFDYYDIAKAVAASQDHEKIEILLQFSARIMGAAIDHGEAGLFKHAGDIVEWVYALTRDQEKVTRFVSDSIDSWIYVVLGHFNFRRGSRAAPETIRAEMAVLLTALGWILRLVKQAIEASCREDAVHFHGRLFEWDKHRSVRGPRGFGYESLPPEMQEVLDLHTYADLVIGAWSFSLVGTISSKDEAALGVFRSTMSELQTRHDLLRVWEWAHSRQFDDAPINDRLGVKRWSQEGGSYRAGSSHFSFGEPDTWVFDGFVALMLARPSASEHVPMPFLAQPPTGGALLDGGALKTKAERLLEDDWIRNEVLDISDEKKDEALSAVTQLIASRQCRYKHARLQEVVAGNVSDGRIEVLREEILDALPGERGLYEMLIAMGATKNPAIAWLPPALDHCPVWKDGFLDTSRGASDFGRHIAQSLSYVESKRIAYGAEQCAKVVGRISVLADLPNAIARAVRELSGRGFSPSIIMIPQQKAFVRALAGTSAWEMFNHHKYGRYHFGTWESYEVVECPYTNAVSIVVLDPGEFFGSVAVDLESALSLEVTEPFVEEHRRWVVAAENEDDPSKIREDHDVDVVSVARLILGLGVRNHEAAVRVDLDLTHLGFAMQQSDRLYHRPTCGLLSASPGIEYSLHTQDGEGDREPCELCAPETWGDEGQPDSNTIEGETT